MPLYGIFIAFLYPARFLLLFAIYPAFFSIFLLAFCYLIPFIYPAIQNKILSHTLLKIKFDYPSLRHFSRCIFSNLYIQNLLFFTPTLRATQQIPPLPCAMLWPKPLNIFFDITFSLTQNSQNTTFLYLSKLNSFHLYYSKLLLFNIFFFKIQSF